MGLGRIPLVALCGWLLILGAAQSATLTVNTTTDEWNTGGSCSIREALDRVRAGSNGRGCTATGAYGTNDTIMVPAGTYTLTRTGGDARDTDDLDVERALTLQGAGGNGAGTVIDASGLGATVQADTNAIEVFSGVTAVFNDIQFQGGRTNSNYRGAGVQNNGTLTLSRCAVVGNTGSASAAGGIGNGGTLTIGRSYIGGNANATSTVGAGTDNNGGSVTIVNSTYGANSGMGAAAYHYSDGSATMTVSYTTFQANAQALTAEVGPIGVGASILNGSCTTSGGGSIADSGYNTDSGTGCGLSAGTSQSSTAIALPAAALNGGTTLNYLIDTSTAAYNRIPSGTLGCGSTVSVDQRGSARPAAPTGSPLNCDIGAIEIAFGDFGDAPASYGVASHSIPSGVADPQPRLGGTVTDSEIADQASADADGDNIHGIDDEDGVVFSYSHPGAFVADTALVNASGSDAYVCGWLDGAVSGSPNGAFESDEGQCSAALSGSQTVSFIWYPPFANTSTLTTFARFRTVASAAVGGDPSLIGPTGPLVDGEVEDHRLLVAPTRAAVGAFRVGLVPGDAGDLIDPETGEPLPVGVALVQWETLSEQGTLGFYLERWDAGSERWVRLHGDLLPGLIDAPLGGEYRLLDRDVAAGERHRYRLIELEAWGTRLVHGPYDIVVGAEQTSPAPRGPRQTRDTAARSGAETRTATRWIGWRRLGADFSGRSREGAKRTLPSMPLDRVH